MSNAYLAMKNRHQKEVEALPLRFAFSNKQYEEAMAKMGLKPNETDKVFSLGGGTGGIYLRTDADKIRETFKRHNTDMQSAIDSDETGEGFIFDMFRYELANHEYCITYDYEETLDALDLTWDEIEKSPKLKHGLLLAKKNYVG